LIFCADKDGLSKAAMAAIKIMRFMLFFFFLIMFVKLCFSYNKDISLQLKTCVFCQNLNCKRTVSVLSFRSFE
jgi:hypothetical protein